LQMPCACFAKGFRDRSGPDLYIEPKWLGLGGEGDNLDPESHPGPMKLGSTVAVDGFFRALGFAWPPFAIGENAMSPSEATLVPRPTASRNAPFLTVVDVGRLAVASRAHRMRMMSDIDS